LSRGKITGFIYFSLDAGFAWIERAADSVGCGMTKKLGTPMNPFGGSLRIGRLKTS
jgi:hypothetical protein